MESTLVEPGAELVFDCLNFVKLCIGLILFVLFVLGDHWLCLGSYYSFFCPYKRIEVDMRKSEQAVRKVVYFQMRSRRITSGSLESSTVL